MNGERPTLQELKNRHPTVPFEAAPPGSLPRNHVAFFRTADGYAYIPTILGPSLRFDEPGGLKMIRYESFAAFAA